MIKVLRGVLAIIVGMLVGFVVVGVGETLSHRVYPPPPGMNIHDPDSLAEGMKSMPGGAFALILLTWAVGTFSGAWVASKITSVGKIWHGLAIGAFFLAAGLSMMIMIPHPTWFMVLGLVEPLPIAYLAGRLAAGSTPRASVAESLV